MKYTTTQGEAWDIISKKKFSSEYNMSQIIELNPQEMDAVLLSGGMKIELPATASIRAIETKAPWEKL